MITQVTTIAQNKETLRV